MAALEGGVDSELAGLFNAWVANWAQMYDCRLDVNRVPELLALVESDDDAEAWTELGYRLVLEHDLLSLASLAALPRLVRLAAGDSAKARLLAGAIMERAASHHDGDELLAASAEAIVELGALLDRHLLSRPADYLVTFRALLAVRGQYHWANVLGDFDDDFYELPCPHCAAEVTIAIGGFGRYAAIRDWDLGDIDRRDLRPSSAGELSGVGRWMHEIAVRDGEDVLAEGIRHLFGKAECPGCASVFTIADEYGAANCPVLR
ncbi:hypothetical protein LG634_35670 [Streptomyces bambusae]|uniref:hypothetical protein n=1 Tax=Streptomyces bambusae TaxID=1550616 RepID=UPI001D001428|nr:hypothetical protein [Streptomyces bambusae]MCB5170127.1 hypothetical protein [Streptomyces bambusae]